MNLYSGVMQRNVCAALFLLILAVAIFVYWSGLNGIFLVDDTYTLASLNERGGVNSWENVLGFVFGNNSGLLGRPVSMLALLVDDQYYPGSVTRYRFTNLMLHCLCGVFLFVLTRQLMKQVGGYGERLSSEIALVSMAWWLLTPLHVSTTLYVVQRMAQLSALFCLIGLCVFLYGRQKALGGGARGNIYIALGLYVFGALAVLSKESGVLLLCFALVIELSIGFSRGEKINKFVVALTLTPMVLATVYVLFRWGFLTHTTVRDFTPIERLLTETRVLWDYLAKIIFPFSGKMGLVHDDIVLSVGLFQPVSTILALIGHAALVLLAFCMRKRSTWLFLGVFGFYAGHLLESSVIPLELYFEHRNYMPSIFVCVGLTALCWSATKYGPLLKTTLILVIVAMAFVSYQRASIWGNPRLQVRIWAAEHPESLRAQTLLVSALSSEKRYEEVEGILDGVRSKWPEAVHLDLMYLNLACMGYIDAEIDTDSLLHKISSGRYDGSLPAVFKETARLNSISRCGLIDDKFMAALYSDIVTIDRAPSTARAQFAILKMEYYGARGNLDATIAALDQAYHYQKVSFVPFLKAGIFYSAGLIDLSIESINLAIALEEKKPPFLRGNLSLYYDMKHRVELGLQK